MKSSSETLGLTVHIFVVSDGPEPDELALFIGTFLGFRETT
jgi:hypothetical protein